MWKNGLKIILLCCLCAILSDSLNAYAAEGELSEKEKYEAMIDKAIGLADLLRTSPDMLHNKLYTAEQEVELRELVDSVCDGQSTDYRKVQRLLSCIYDKLEPGPCQKLNAWDTLCDGETGWRNSSNELAGTKKQAGEMEYCYTFYDVCRLADIPCFMLSNSIDCIAMVYLEKEPGTGKDWYFVDVASEKSTFVSISRENVYEKLAERISDPDRLVLDYYGQSRHYRNSIFLEKLVEDDRPAPCLVYDSDTNTVKGYFPVGGYLAVGEQYGYTESYFGDNGEAPSGLIETKYYDEGKVTTYRSYAVYGVFLRGRVEQDGKEYDLQAKYDSNIPFYAQNAVESGPESDEHSAFVKNYREQLEDKASRIADALLADENYIWNDINFSSEEDEQLVRDAVETALDWDYIQDSELSRIAFENVGIPYVPWEEQAPEFMDKAKAQAILLYIKRNVKSVDDGYVDATSADVLKSKAGICAGIAILFRDMCVMADIPCFRLRCALNMNMGDACFGDHIDNMIKAGDEWLFCDPTNAGLIGKGGCIQMSIIEGYDAQPAMASHTWEILIDRDVMRKDNYGKWDGYGTVAREYFELDDNGKLAIYRRDRWGEPVLNNRTDENGRYTLENGLHTVDVLEETDGVEIVTRYAYYYQNLRNLEGKKTIDGTKYDFSTNIFNVGYGYHKLQEVSRKYDIAYMDFQTLADQPYHKDGACPVPEIYHGDKKLELGKDFEIVEYRNNKALSTSYQNASYQVKGLGDYIGNATRQFKIVEADISQLEVTLSQTSFIWKPSGILQPEVEVPGLNWADYSVEYFDFGNVGTARVVVTGRTNSTTRKKNATGSVTLEYEILPYRMQAEDIQAEYTETVYNGKVQKPEVTVAGFPKGRYYEVSYEKMTDGAWQEAEPKEAGAYRIAVQMTENVELIKDGEKIPNTYYIGYSIQAEDSSGSTPEMTLPPTPEASETPVPPEIPEAPKPTHEPNTTISPKPTPKPDITAKPDTTVGPNLTAKPDITGSPKPTNEPDSTENPNPTDGTNATESPLEGTVLQDTKNKVSYKVISQSSMVTFYEVNDKEATKTVVPDTVSINGIKYKVTAISDHAFNGCKKLKSVTIGKYVTTIGNKAFFKCTSLKKITIPASLTRIGKKAFYGCKKLKSITIKTKKLNSKSVGVQAFKGIYKKAVIKVPEKQKKAYQKWLRKKGISKKMKIK